MNSRLVVDSGVLLLYFFIIIFIGLRMGRKEDNLEDFALGGRRIPWWAVLASIIAAETSAGTFFGTPGEGYALRNFTYIQLAFGTILARILVSYIFIKPYYDYKVYSIYEYLTLRFGVGTKNAASAVFMFTRVLASGARLYVAAIALALAYEMIRGVRPGQSETLLIYVGAIVVIVILTAIYTTLGGIKAVVWTDFIQASIMIGSALAAVALLYSAIPGGWHEIVARKGGFHLDDFITTGLDPARHGWDKIKGMFEVEYTIFAGLIGSTFITMATHGTDQDMVQRMLTAVDIRRSRRSLILSGLADIPIALTFLTIGLLLWVYYQSHFDPNLPKTPNETFCHFILYEMPIGLRGLLIAGIFATAMGSLSTALNALATSFTRDWYETYINRNASKRREPACRSSSHCRLRDSDDRCRLGHIVFRHRAAECAHHSDRARHLWLHLWLGARRFSRRHANKIARKRSRKFYRHDRRVYRRHDSERFAKQPREDLRNGRLQTAGLASENGISLVDLFRNDRHVSSWRFCSGLAASITRQT